MITLSTPKVITSAKNDLSGMTKAELIAYAKENNISGVDSDMKKAEILDIIKNSE